ncbi:MAG TPA: PBP1A family penicillin-binding protein [Candidatus Sulfopaludibacter sp.]|nr:PBP1A family penicillin-binding protein [Candidatus Sulfopaludibacter sp.]
MRYARLIDQRLARGPFSSTVNVYASPRTIALGDQSTIQEIVQGLRNGGYSTSRGNSAGWYNLRPHAVEIFPGRDSLPGSESAVLEFTGNKVSRIISLADNSDRRQFQLEPQFLTNISGHREQRRLVRYSDIPPVLVQAVISVEDKHFFTHTGFDMFRILKAAYVDMKNGRKDQGASTLSMQLARGFFLDSDKRWRRKAEELLITMQLEHKLSKEKIFEYYANQVYLGRHSTFSINGFGEGARAFFDKDLSQVTLPEAALLAGLVQRPSYLNPYRYPDRARERRDVVLALMKENGYISDAAYRDAINTPVKIASEQAGTVASQYFVDLVGEELQTSLGDRQKEVRSIFTTLDPGLQRAAEEAVSMGMQNVDKQLYGKKGRKSPAPSQPQVALVALDPRTGEIKALVGGRNYDNSQLNHALAMRQPGSVFKPFVYAAALDTAVSGGNIFTPASILSDSPTDFQFGKTTYHPGNFKQEYMGDVTLRTALAHSLNAATVSLAQKVGYGKVVAMARRAGLNEDIKPTPSVALGSYETTPLEIAGAYTMFANQGLRLTPSAISVVRSADGSILYQHDANGRASLDPRVAYLMVSMLQEVLRSGTGAGVHSYGFNLPAAGKTGTSRDGWFAGFTTELLCVVWVGFDNNSDLKLEGAHSALPIWAEFMKRAAQYRPYRDARPFPQVAGVVTAQICNDSGQLAGPFCPNVRSEVFIDGTQPAVTCELHSGDATSADRVIELPNVFSALPLKHR